MKLISPKKKLKIAKGIIKCGFSEQDIIDAADAILDKEPYPYINGVYHGKSRKVVKEGSKASRKESYQKGKEQVKAKGEKAKGKKG